MKCLQLEKRKHINHLEFQVKYLFVFIPIFFFFLLCLLFCFPKFCFLVDRRMKVPGVGMVLVGTVIQGVAYPGKDVIVAPVNKKTHIKTLHLAIPKKSIEVAFPGDYIGMAVSGGIEPSDVHSRRLGILSGNGVSDETKKNQ